MKKFLYNQARTKIYNLDMVVSIEKPKADEELILLRFPYDQLSYFAVYGNENIKELYSEKEGLHSVIQWSGDYEVNHKLFQYFDHKFTHSALCQKQQQKVESNNNEQ